MHCRSAAGSRVNSCVRLVVLLPARQVAVDLYVNWSVPEPLLSRETEYGPPPDSVQSPAE